jgi:hypothetical protein
VIAQRSLSADDRPALAELLQSVEAFTDDERAVALELVDARLARPESTSTVSSSAMRATRTTTRSGWPGTSVTAGRR